MLAPHPHPAPLFPQAAEDQPFRVEAFAAQRALERRARAMGPLALEVARGLTRASKRLAPKLLLDAEGARVAEEIARLPGHYLGRAEAEILRDHADDIMAAVCSGSRRHLEVLELGAGSAAKTQILLEAAVRARCVVDYIPIDTSRAALEAARSRLTAEVPGVVVRPMVASPIEALASLRHRGIERMVVLLGGALGDHDNGEAVDLLSAARGSLRAGELLLIGLDTKKPAHRLIAAYDDGQGVNARFDRGVLRRINAELGGQFVLPHFRHVVSWNELQGRVETYLESTVAQSVVIEALGLTVSFQAGERVQVRTSHKYDDAQAERILAAAGFASMKTWRDRERLFSVRLARAA